MRLREIKVYGDSNKANASSLRGLGPDIKLGQTSPKWDKSGAEPKYTETDLKKSMICPIWG